MGVSLLKQTCSAQEAQEYAYQDFKKSNCFGRKSGESVKV